MESGVSWHARLLNLPSTRLVEIAGEAGNRVPDTVQANYPELPWLQMIGVRFFISLCCRSNIVDE
jgi:uncharacterized protein with HEPN domain